MTKVGFPVGPTNGIVVVGAGFGAFCGKAVLIQIKLSNSNNVIVRAGFGPFCLEKGKG